MEWLGEAGLRRDVDLALSKAWRGGSFAPQLEERYQAANWASDCVHNKTAVLACMVLFDAFGISDLRLAPDTFWLSMILRLAVFNPLIMLVIFMGRRTANRHLYKSIISAGAVLGTLITCFLLDLTRSPGVIADCYGIPMIVLFSNLLLRTGLPYRLASTILSILIYLPMVIMAPVIPLQQIPVLVLTELAAAALSLMAVFHLEQRERQVFLLLLRERLQAKELSLENHELKALTHTDALSGVSNRRHFDTVLPAAWGRAVDQQQAIALLLFDIDHFKLYNDRYGHPAGDICLRRIAFTAQQQLRWDTDLLARYGGEEFAIILPEANAEMAAQVAERIRESIEVLQLPHAGVGPDAVITVTIGAVSVVPDSRQTPDQLVEIADSELYAAKQAGRNRVFIKSGRNRICVKRPVRISEPAPPRAADPPKAYPPPALHHPVSS